MLFFSLLYPYLYWGNIKLLSANTKGYKRLELHKTVFQGGMMKMIKQDLE
jgi:copper(I)-binding protein